MMAGLLIFEEYPQFYSFVTNDNTLYEMMKKDLASKTGTKILFEQGGVTLEQLDNARDSVSDVVKRLNEKQEVDVSKELSDYFSTQPSKLF